ncbi:MAG: DUF3341 domain-containing protein, partial [Thermoanaerobaculum sp.]
LRVVPEPKLWGLAAEFATVEAFLSAVEACRKAGYRHFDAHAPIPVHGLDEAMDIKPSRLPKLVFLGGLSGCALGLALQWWTNAVDYPFRISGKPLFALPPAIPVVFELTVLFSAITAVIGLLVANRQPEFYHPLLELPAFAKGSDDRFFVVVEARDPAFDLHKTREFLAGLGAEAVYPLEVS